MSEGKYIWENERFRKDPYKIPEGYFDSFGDRVISRLNNNQNVVPEDRLRFFRPWMVWVSSIAAVLAIGWFGFHTFYFLPVREARLKENIELFVDFCGEELHEGQLAGFFENAIIEVTEYTFMEIDDLIQIEPDLAEESMYESVGF